MHAPNLTDTITLSHHHAIAKSTSTRPYTNYAVAVVVVVVAAVYAWTLMTSSFLPKRLTMPLHTVPGPSS